MQENYRAVLNSMMKHGIAIPRNGVLHRCLSVIAPDLEESEIQITGHCPSSKTHTPPYKELMPSIAVTPEHDRSIHVLYVYVYCIHVCKENMSIEMNRSPGDTW